MLRIIRRTPFTYATLAICLLLWVNSNLFAAPKLPAVGNIEGIVSITNQSSNCRIEGSLVYIPGLSHFTKLGSDGQFKLIGVKTSTTPYKLRLEVPGAQAVLDTSVLVDRETVNINPNANSVCPEKPNCNDNNACTFDSDTNGFCSNTPISCDDGDPNTLDACDTVSGCQHQPIQTCTDGETRFCYSGPSGSSGIGICQSGIQTCSSGEFGACTGEVLPEPEICGDGLDNDCDGIVDEGCTADVPGDCRNADGTVNDSDIPASDQCVTGVCSNGVPLLQLKPDGTACSIDGSTSGICTSGTCTALP